MRQHRRKNHCHTRRISPLFNSLIPRLYEINPERFGTRRLVLVAHASQVFFLNFSESFGFRSIRNDYLHPYIPFFSPRLPPGPVRIPSMQRMPHKFTPTRLTFGQPHFSTAGNQNRCEPRGHPRIVPVGVLANSARSMMIG